jgi:phage shock protein C
MARAARRAERLAQRAKERADRKARRATEAAERAEELARRASRQARKHAKDVEESIEDLVDDVAERWSEKAEEWIDRTREELLGEKDSFGEHSTDDYGESESLDDSSDAGRKRSRSARRRRRSRHYYHRPRVRRSRSARARVRSFRHRLRNGRPLYRNPKEGKVCGVCAGFAEYYDVETWQVRLGALLGLFFLPSLTVPSYFIAYFLMDKKPYYRRMTDDMDEAEELDVPLGAQGSESVRSKRPRRGRKARPRTSAQEFRPTNATSLRQAKSMFADLESRVRSMETHVTDSKFELQRELKKISGED